MKKAGFTLIELLIAVSIFAVVAIALYSTFFAGISVWKRSGEGGNIYQDIKFAFGDMTKDLKNAVYCTKEEESIFAFSGTNEEIIFIALEPGFSEKGEPPRELVKMAYRLDKETDQLIRMRADKSSGFDIEKAEKEALLDNVEEFKFEYCYDTGDKDDPYEWKDEWTDEEMKVPRGVKVKFLIKAEKGDRKALEFTKIIFVPTGDLGKEPIGLGLGLGL